MRDKLSGCDRLFSFIAADGQSTNSALPIVLNLVNHFDSVSGIFRASRKELLSVPGVTSRMVERIHDIRNLAQSGVLPSPRKSRARQPN